MLRSRILRMSMLAFSTLWFGVLVPVHQRGLIRVAGTASSAGASCCASMSSRSDASNHSSRKAPASSCPRPTASCAVCQFIATLDLPPAVIIDVPSLGLLAAAPVVRHESPACATLRRPCSERGPPVYPSFVA